MRNNFQEKTKLYIYIYILFRQWESKDLFSIYKQWKLYKVLLLCQEESQNHIRNHYISSYLPQLKGRLSSKCCIQSPWHPSAYTNSPPATSLFLAASDLHSFAWFYDVHILCSDCMMMQKKPSIRSTITWPAENYLDITF